MALSIVKLSLCAFGLYLLFFLHFNGVVGVAVDRKNQLPVESENEFVGSRRAAGSAGFSNYRHQHHVSNRGQNKWKEGHAFNDFQKRSNAFNDFQKRSNAVSFRGETQMFSTRHVSRRGQYKWNEGHVFNDFQRRSKAFNDFHKRSNAASFRGEIQMFSTAVLRTLKQERPHPNTGTGPKHH